MTVTSAAIAGERPERSVAGRALVALSLAAFLVNLDRAIFSPLLPALSHDLRSTIAATGQAVTAYVIPYGLFQLLYGPLGDRVGKVTVVRWAVLLFAVGTGGCGLVAGLPMLYVLRAATGACAAAVIPLALAYIGDMVPYEERQRAIASLMGYTALGNVLSTAVGGIVGGFLTWRALFLLYGVCALAVAVLLFRVPGGPAAPASAGVPPGGPWQRYAGVLTLARARQLYGLVALEGVFVTGGFTYIGAYLRQRFQLEYLLIGLILAGYAGGTLLTSRYLLRRALVRWGERSLILGGGLLLAAGLLLLLVLPVWLLVVATLGMGAGFAFFHSTLQTRATELAPGVRGTAVAIFAFSLFLGAGLGTAFLGWVLNVSGYPLLLAIAGGGMAGITLAARQRWPAVHQQAG